MRNLPTRQQRLIDETGAWLTWALENNIDLPSIPRQKVADGGFSALSNIPGARIVFARWWRGTLDLLEK